MPKEPIVLRNAASDEQVRKNAANSAVLRNSQPYNQDYPGIEPPVIDWSNIPN
jgi:hypothetical protein